MPPPRATHSATMSCRHSAPTMSTTLNTYWLTCPMRCNHTRISLTATHRISLSFWLEHTSHPLSPRPGAARGCREEPRVCGRPQCAERSRQPPTLSSSHLPAPPIAHTQGRCSGREREVRRTTHAKMHTQQQRHPRRTARKIHAHRTHTTAGEKRRSASKSRAQSFTSLCHDKLAWRLTAVCGGLVFHTHSEARRTPSALLRVHSAGRRPATLLPSQWGTQTIVVADHRCL
ncbi:hypothetical protein TcCL_Unassigned03798 [Trypanosoma cruzi]|nr:hypothetical protein TcCL_Unassigned03798 [Trypanosoma cruzi]